MPGGEVHERRLRGREWRAELKGSYAIHPTPTRLLTDTSNSFSCAINTTCLHTHTLPSRTLCLPIMEEIAPEYDVVVLGTGARLPRLTWLRS